jgi:hypothetical protein
MNTLQRRIHTLEASVEIAGYFFGAVIEQTDSFYASLWREFSDFPACVKAEFFTTQAEGAAWLCGELAETLPVFFVENQSLAKMEVCAGGKMKPAQVDQALWERANKNEVLTWLLN